MNGIGILGEAQAGKDTVARILVQRHDFVRRGFADALKEDVGLSLLHWTDPQYIEHRVYARKYVDGLKPFPEIRTLLQAYGAARRALDQDYWIRRLFAWAGREHPGDSLVIPDVRYRNEAEYLRKVGFRLIRVVRPGHDNGLTEVQRNHPSERELAAWRVDWQLSNDGTLADLAREVDALVASFC